MPLSSSGRGTCDLWHFQLRPRFALLLLLTVALLTGPLLGYVAHCLAAKRIEDRTIVHFDDYLTDQVYALRSRIQGIGEVLASVRAFYASSESVTREEFATYAAALRSRHSSIRAVEWVPRVPSGERAEYEEALGREAGAGRVITEPDGAGGLVPAAEREEYFPVHYVEPVAGNEVVVGLDLGSTVDRRSVLDRAAATRDVAFSEPIRLVQDRTSAPSVLAVLPVPRRPASGGPIHQGSREGFVVVCVGVRDLVRECFRHFSSGSPAPMLFRLEDAGVLGPGAVLDFDLGAPSAIEWLLPKRIDAGGRHWQFHARPSLSFLDRHRTRLPLLLGLATFLGWELLLILAFVLVRHFRGLSLRQSARLVQTVFGRLTEGVLVADPSGRRMTFNDAARTMIGQGELGVPLSDWSRAYGCYLPDGVTPYPSMRLPLARAVRGEMTTDEEVFIRHAAVPDGVWLTVSGAPLLDARGRIIGGVVVTRDVTERRKVDETLDRLSNAVEQAADVVFITSRSGVIEYVNPAFERVFGYSSAEAVGQSPRILKSGLQTAGYYRELWQTLLAGKVFRGNTVNRRKDGSLVHVEQIITPVKDSRGEVSHFVSVVRDMTEKRKQDEHQAEMRAAATVQQHLYPTRTPHLGTLDVAGAALPASATCGDYYDFIPMEDGSLVLAIGDVSGHGLGAAMLMVETRAYLRSLVRLHADLGRVFGLLNRYLCEDLESSRFVSLLAMRINPRSGRFVYACAGHPPGLIVDRDGALRTTLSPTGPALGLYADSEYVCPPPTPIAAGDVVVLVTDGVTETRASDGTFFDDGRLLDVVREHRHESAARIVELLTRATTDFAPASPRSDDWTAIVCRMGPAPVAATDGAGRPDQIPEARTASP